MNPYTLWLVPPIEVMAECQSIIDEYGKKYLIHTFQPHITLTGGIRPEKNHLIELIESVLDDVKPLDITIPEISISTTFFQCVFARVTPTPQLLDLHVALRSACNIVAEDFFMPHMSLVYGDLPSIEKQHISNQIVFPTTHFTCNTVYLVDGQSKDISTWKRIKEFKLS